MKIVPKASRNTRVVFSNLIVQKDKPEFSKKTHETNGATELHNPKEY